MSTVVLPAFEPFPKIGRLRREIIITEKIDGTNGCIYVPEDDGALVAGSRTRWIVPGQDNHGFARWVDEHEEELRAGLGPGTHFGEWWGLGIQRRYGQDRKRFSLFNVGRWGDDSSEARPECCDVVPVLARYEALDSAVIGAAMSKLGAYGSLAAPGFMRPEGIVVFHPQSRQSFKWTFEKDDDGKGQGA